MRIETAKRAWACSRKIFQTWQHRLKIANKPIIHRYGIFVPQPWDPRTLQVHFDASLSNDPLLTFCQSRKSGKTEISVFHVIESRKSHLLTVTCWNDISMRDLPVRRAFRFIHSSVTYVSWTLALPVVSRCRRTLTNTAASDMFSQTYAHTWRWGWCNAVLAWKGQHKCRQKIARWHSYANNCTFKTNVRFGMEDCAGCGRMWEGVCVQLHLTASDG